MVLQISGKLNELQSLGIPLKHLNGIPAELCGVYQALDRFLDMGDGMLYAAGKYMGKLCLLTLLRFFDTQLRCLLGRVALQRTDLMLMAITIGRPTSTSCVVRYRLRSMLVPSMIFRITSGFSCTR